MDTRTFANSAAMLLIGSVLLGTTGCQSTGKNKLTSMNPVKKLVESETTPKVPDRLVGTWTEAVLHQSGEGVRGFGGRLYFYERGSNKPVRVDGQLVVYAFAEDGRDPTDNRPTKRYVFPPSQFANHESESEIGISYSVWLPWDAAGGEQTEVSLIARFEPLQGGGLVVGEQTRHMLPGRPRKETMLAEEAATSSVIQASAAGTAATGAKQAAFEEVAQDNSLRMSATTISLPPRFNNSSLKKKAKPKQSSVEKVRVGKERVSKEKVGEPATEHKPTPFGTTVDYLTPGESVRRSVQQRSFDSLHSPPPAAGIEAAPPVSAPSH